MKQFITSENGATAVEYSMIGGVIALMIALSAQSIGVSINDTFNCLGNVSDTGLPSNGETSC